MKKRENRRKKAVLCKNACSVCKNTCSKIAIISERFRNFASETELKTITIMKRKLCPPKPTRLAVVLVSVFMLLVAACSDKNSPASNVQEAIKGRWYYEHVKHGTIGEGDAAVHYDKIVLCGTFEEEGEGFWSLIFVNKDNKAISPNGNSYWANCTYTVSGKTVKVQLTSDYLPVEPTEWVFDYSDGKLSTPYDGQTIQLAPITTEQYTQYQQWMRQLGFGFSDDDAASYNINDKDINATNWRDQAGLYIYDGVGTDVTDDKGRTGYTAVYFPWYKGMVNSNLDPTFCDDILPENGWEWVLNLCGNRTIVNNNFFALYNKYSGVLRFFYYMPISFTSGDDHMWEIDMTELMAQCTVWGFGLPLDMNFSNKAAFGQDRANLYYDYITPYFKSLAPDGKITPNAGWWAFDIDMSLYRPNEKTFSDGQNIGLQMRSWKQNHVSLTSAITGKLAGEISLDQTRTITTVSKKKGLFGILSDVVSVGKSAVGAITSAKSGNVGAAIKGAIDVGKGGYNLYGEITKKGSTSTTTTDTLSNIRGTISINVDASAETDGIISSSVPVTGVASPTIPANSFTTAGTHLGEGVWNIKSSPVVYAWVNSKGDQNSAALVDYLFRPYFFDPSSVDVVLNPELFPESDIEWTQVEAICGVTPRGTGNFRQAVGLDYTLGGNNKESAFFPQRLFDYEKIDKKNVPKFSTDSTYKPYYWFFDFLYGLDDKQGLDYAFNEDFKGVKIAGRGVGGEYYIEPFASCSLPDLEVSVTVVVKLHSKEHPIVLQRSYIPKYVTLNINDIAQAEAVYNQIVSKSKVDGKIERGPLYDYQLKRIFGMLRILSQDFGFKLLDVTAWDCAIAPTMLLRSDYYNCKILKGKEEIFHCFDCDYEIEGDRWFEWSYDKPAVPVAYEWSQSLNAGKDDHPATWVLKAKLNEGDDWTVIAVQPNNGKGEYISPYGSGNNGFLTAQFKLKDEEKGKPWRYYRWEIPRKQAKEDWGSTLIQNFKLIY